MTFDNTSASDLRYLRPAKADCLRRAVDGYGDRTGSLSVEVYNDIVLAGRGQQPGIEKREGRFIDDCDYYAELSAPVGDELFFAGRTLYGGWFRHAWGHFLVNSTARLWPVFNGSAAEADNIVFFSDDDDASLPGGNFSEFFALAGILPLVKVVPANARCRFEHLVIGEPALEGGVYTADEFMLPIDRVRAAALEAHSLAPSPRPLLLARSSWHRKGGMQINVDLIEDIFQAAGYQTLAPEATGLGELIARMAAAPQTASFSGSAAHNFLFCRNTNLIILERCAANNMYQAAISRLNGCRTTLVDCFWQPLLSSSTDNLTIFGLTPQFEAFATDQAISLAGMACPDATRDFRRYMRIYRRHYGYAPGLNDWETSQLPAITEAYFASEERYSHCLKRHVPVVWSDWLSPRVWWHMLKAWQHRCGRPT